MRVYMHDAVVRELWIRCLRSPTARSNGPPQSSLRRAKRWSSTGDFTHSPQNQGSNSQLVGTRLARS